MGQALNILIGWDIFTSAMLVAAVSTTYVAFGGQTSVIMTDLFQGVMLLITGLLLLLFGIEYLGGFDMFWTHLPRSHRLAFPNFNEDPSYPAVGIFWARCHGQFSHVLFLNQGMVMRLMAARSVDDSRKVRDDDAVGSHANRGSRCRLWRLGWTSTNFGWGVARHGTQRSIFITSSFLSQPGVFGLVMGASDSGIDVHCRYVDHRNLCNRSE